MKKKQIRKRGSFMSYAENQHPPMIYVDVADGVFRASVGGAAISLKRFDIARARVRFLHKNMASKTQFKHQGIIPYKTEEVQNLSATILAKTGLRISPDMLGKIVGGIYPPLCIVMNGNEILTIK